MRTMVLACGALLASVSGVAAQAMPQAVIRAPASAVATTIASLGASTGSVVREQGPTRVVLERDLSASEILQLGYGRRATNRFGDIRIRQTYALIAQGRRETLAQVRLELIGNAGSVHETADPLDRTGQATAGVEALLRDQIAPRAEALARSQTR